MDYSLQFDVIVVGGGHAGTEAALAAARMGCRTLLLTQSIDNLGQMSCNPAIGGIGKGHLVKEIDAMGGAMGRAADACGIHFRTLNARKGPAVRATRAQIDRMLYRGAIRAALESAPNLRIVQQTVEDLHIRETRVGGVVTQMGVRFTAPSVVLTVGTFLGGCIHVGDSKHSGGRVGDPASIKLAQRLRELPFGVGRLKTGTPPRIDGGTIDFSKLEVQMGDSPRPVFSCMSSVELHPRQLACHITHTNARTHAIIESGLSRSPLFNGRIEGTGPRYCPSIEDKVVRFAGKQSHQIFVEPEGLNTTEVYPNGISTSLPFDIQVAFVKSIRGFEQAHITRPGYAIEYDFFEPRDLHASLETKYIEGLFFAGQINGTTGYEEAAAQGLIAGLNAARRAQGAEPWAPRRDQAYAGVLIDDLITRGTNEPYRMFTSRAEYRLSLREDNADLRLTPIARSLGLVGDEQWRRFCAKREALETERQRLEHHWLRADDVAPGEAARVLGRPLRRDTRLLELLRRPQVTYAALMSLPGAGPACADPAVAEQLEIQAKYSGYIERQEGEIARTRRNEGTAIPDGFDYSRVRGLSTEIVEKLSRYRPDTLGQAARISGVTPAAISLLLVHIRKHHAALLESA